MKKVPITQSSRGGGKALVVGSQFFCGFPMLFVFFLVFHGFIRICFFLDGWIRVFSRVGSGSVSLGSDPNLDFSVRSEFLDAGIRVFLKGRIRISFIRIRNLDFVYIGNLRICRVIYQCALGCPLHRNIFFKP